MTVSCVAMHVKYLTCVLADYVSEISSTKKHDLAYALLYYPIQRAMRGSLEVVSVSLGEKSHHSPGTPRAPAS